MNIHRINDKYSVVKKFYDSVPEYEVWNFEKKKVVICERLLDVINVVRPNISELFKLILADRNMKEVY